MTTPRIVDLNTGEWFEHVRFPGVMMKGLLTSTDNALANVNAVHVPSGAVIGRHRHSQQVETIWIIRGEPILTLDQTDIQLTAGQITAIPIGLEHALRNEASDAVELLTIFTPPLE